MTRSQKLCYENGGLVAYLRASIGVSCLISLPLPKVSPVVCHYAYYKIAQRYLVEVESGKQILFDAFLGSNAQQLFEMTRLSK